jgi:hypothetical protein
MLQIFFLEGWRLLLLEFLSSSYGFKKKYGFFSDKTVKCFKLESLNFCYKYKLGLGPDFLLHPAPDPDRMN